ncbi:MFS transporter [Corynebacterium sp. A21]|uniref:MFS transporter n=1 Tax=Corynebacterium sp. A21 TaxID=3457318 RepID=UPI003FD346A1
MVGWGESSLPTVFNQGLQNELGNFIGNLPLWLQPGVGPVLGPHRVLLAGTIVFGLASLLIGLAPTFQLLVAARILQGMGEALALPAAMATIVLMFPEGPRRSRALSEWAVIASCGLVLGFILSGVITKLLGWRWIFLIAVPFILLVFIAVLILIPVDQQRKYGIFDLPNAVLLTAARLVFAFGIIELREIDGRT